MKYFILVIMLASGKGCIATLGVCGSYIGDELVCSGFKGSLWKLSYK